VRSYAAFMVITPLLAKTFWIHTPRQEKEVIDARDLQPDPTPPLVLHVGADQSLQLNGSVVAYDELPDRLRHVFAARTDHVLFFDADDRTPYGAVVRVMDQAREGGAVTIAALTAALTQLPPGPGQGHE